MPFYLLQLWSVRISSQNKLDFKDVSLNMKLDFKGAGLNTNWTSRLLVLQGGNFFGFGTWVW
uniref:Uncharacterized protein n=1 Tax=Rhizophagus irregularis (strain DAOM 181602 / DAOM 197198 / MUCL 43194) TaxID=747089 RepID=U9SNF2_RHIID